MRVSHLRFFGLVLALSTIVALLPPRILAQPTPRPAEPSATSIPARSLTLNKADYSLKTLCEEIAKQTGLTVQVAKDVEAEKVPLVFDKTPVWVALEQIAEAKKLRIIPESLGRQLKLAPLPENVAAAPSSTNGPFRVVVKDVVAKRDFENGNITYDVHLEAMWESQVVVYYMDTEPAILGVVGAKPGTQASGRSPTNGCTQPLVVRLKEIPRSTTKIPKLDINLNALAADKMMAVKFDTIKGEKASSVEKDGVTITMNPAKQVKDRIDIVLQLEYPKDHPHLESFEGFAGGNKLRLQSHDAKTTLETKDFSTNERGNLVTCTYSFPWSEKQTLEGWRAIYETPTQLKNVSIKFTVKDIELP